MKESYVKVQPTAMAPGQTALKVVMVFIVDTKGRSGPRGFAPPGIDDGKIARYYHEGKQISPAPQVRGTRDSEIPRGPKQSRNAIAGIWFRVSFRLDKNDPRNHTKSHEQNYCSFV